MTDDALSALPVAVLGAGPVGLAAAVRLVERGITPLVLEQGGQVGEALLCWGHVRVFSPWTYNIDAAARVLLAGTGWRAPDPEGLPTGAEIVRAYLRPLAGHPALAPHILLGARVEAVTREGMGKLGAAGRAQAPLVLRWREACGAVRTARARAVIDASGTWDTPNPIGVDGLPVRGETDQAERIAYGIPDVRGRDRARYAGRRVLVIGGGHSAINVALDLLRLQERAPDTRILWALRRPGIERLLGGGLNDQLPERGALGIAALRAIEAGRLEVLAPFAVERIAAAAAGLALTAMHDGRPVTLAVDRIVAATGFRPDFAMLRELRIALDATVEAPPALAPLIDPSLHSCGSVPPHGAAELAHPEPGFYIAGAKSYGRAPTFLMATGYEQVRSIVAEIAGDHSAARAVHLVLPETGVCSAAPARSGADAACCADPASTPSGVVVPAASACCGTGAAAGGARACGVTTGSAALPLEPAVARRGRVIAALGVTQILAWGSTSYLLAVLAGPIAADTGWPRGAVIGGISVGLLVSGLVSIRVGRAIERFGGRPVLAASSLLLAAGLCGLALAPRVEIYLAAWVVLGIGMGAGLYDAAFSTLGRLFGRDARGAITSLTLWGGFASTVCWPLSAVLVETLGWRGACLVYAGLQLAVALPLHLLALPREAESAPRARPAPSSPAWTRTPVRHPRLVLALLAVIFTTGGAVWAMISVHLIAVLQASGLTLAAAVALGALIGPAQVGARVIEMIAGRHYHPLWTLAVAVFLITAGLALLRFGAGLPALAIIAYGAGNGIWSIARGALPLALFGPVGYAVLMGRLATPSLIAQALAPSLGAVLILRFGAPAMLTAITAVSAANLLATLLLWASVPQEDRSLQR